MKIITYLMTALVLSACGGNTQEEERGDEIGVGGSAGTGGSTATGGSAGTGGSTATGGSPGTGGAGGAIPDKCLVETNEPGPYPVTFSFVSNNVEPVYLFQQCRIQFDVQSCTDDYQSALEIAAECTVDCNEPPTGSCIQCSPCMSLMLPVSNSTKAEASWHGNTYTFDKNADECPCHNTFEAPAGKYRIEVPVYPTSEPYESDPIRTTIVDFTLPAPNDTVTIDLTAP